MLRWRAGSRRSKRLAGEPKELAAFRFELLDFKERGTEGGIAGIHLLAYLQSRL